jgi:putative hydrolase of the HAD superfamily
VGHAKPSRQIFEAALDKHRLTPDNAIHVGDSETNDLQGAINAGLNGLLVDREIAGTMRNIRRDVQA